MTVRVQTQLPIPAEKAFELAQKLATFRHVTFPILRVSDLPDRVEEGNEVSARIYFFGLLPAWWHNLRLVHVRPYEIYSNEQGGPVKTWNHRLHFEATSEASCRYTDEVEITAGLLTPFVWLFAQLIYRYRQMRWRALAGVLA